MGHFEIKLVPTVGHLTFSDILLTGETKSITTLLFTFSGVSSPSPSQAAAICCRLGAWRLLLVESGRRDLEQRIRLNVNQDDVLYALQKKGT